MTKFINAHHSSYLLFIMFLLIIIGSVSCLSVDNDAPKITLMPTPSFLLSVDPETMIDHEIYNQSLESNNWPMARGIVVTIRADKIGIKDKNRNVEVLEKRVKLYIDGDRISNELLLIAHGGERGTGPFYISWAPQLLPGSHQAMFRILSDSGDISEYTWNFIINE